MKLEIISNINMDSLKFYMKNCSFLNKCSFGNYMIDLLDEQSPLYQSDCEMVILFLDVEELPEESIDDILAAVEKFTNKSNKVIILNTVCYLPLYPDTFLHKSFENELKINTKILNFNKEHTNVLLFDFLKLIKQENFFDEKYWYMGRIKFSKKGFEKIAGEIERLINTYRFGSKKVLVLDLDNTLWGGVIGEEEIQLANDGTGKIYLDFQAKIKKLKEFGILLAVNSKNNYQDGIEGLNHPNSILKEEDFILKKINWNDKASNMIEILEDLELGAESIVFIDDNPVERALMKKSIPEINIPEFPGNIFDLNSWFLGVIESYFTKLALTNEDLKKQEQYVAKLNRKRISKNISYDDFINDLNIKLDFYIDDDSYIKRYAQLTQKTNQFNLTTIRYTEAQIRSFIKDRRYKVIAVNYEDIFINEGIIGLVITCELEGFIEIDTLLLSCRVLKRGVEKAIFEKLDELYPNNELLGKYIPTPKNVLVQDLYKKFGFKEINKNEFIMQRNTN